jgi:hypothetical protein
VLILPPDHAQALRGTRRFTVREKWILSSVVAVVVALLAAVLISIGSGGHRTANGCVDVTFPIAIGGQEIYECGDRARALCRSASAASGSNAVADRAIATQCRKVGLKVGA